VLERIPARDRDVDWCTPGVGWKSAAARAVVATGNHKTRWFSAGIEDEIASEPAARVIDGGRPVESPIEMCLGPRDIEIDIDSSLISPRRKNCAIATPVRVWAVINRLRPASGCASVGARIKSESRVIAVCG